MTLTCGFLFVHAATTATTRATRPSSPASSASRGEVVHPQHWPEDLDYAGKRVVVIGSGATAVTLVPAMAETRRARDDAAALAHLRRLAARRGPDRRPRCARVLPDARRLRDRALEERAACRAVFYQLSRRAPELMKKLLRARRDQARCPPATTSTPTSSRATTRGTSASAWSPTATSSRRSGDGSAEIVTDRDRDLHRRRASSSSPGTKLEADIVVTATGLNLLLLGGMRGHRSTASRVDLPRTSTYKGMMLSDVPNFAFTLGYTNASWTLKADLISEYVCRLLNHMDATGYRDLRRRAVNDPSVTEEPLLDFNSGYVLRSIDQLPKQGSKEPWQLHQNYPLDLRMLRHGPIDDGTMRFSNPAPVAQPEATQPLASAS